MRFRLLLILLPAFVTAAPEPWMRSQEPGVLSVMSGAESGCPMSADDVRTEMESLLADAGIETVRFSQDGEQLLLYGLVECSPIGDGGWIFRSEVGFDSPNHRLSRWVGGAQYKTLGAGDRDALLAALRRDLRAAIADYKESNRDYDF